MTHYHTLYGLPGYGIAWTDTRHDTPAQAWGAVRGALKDNWESRRRLRHDGHSYRLRILDCRDLRRPVTHVLDCGQGREAMSTTPVPRLVGATWYAVPCPEGVPLTLGFPSEEACRSFCEAIGGVLDAQEEEIEREQEQSWDSGREAGHEDGYHEGWDEGYDEALLDAKKDCLAGKCVARSAESA